MFLSRRRACLALMGVLAALGCSADGIPTDPQLLPAGRFANTQAPLELVQGPMRFTRGTGAPVQEFRTLSTAGFEAPFELRVTSGDAYAKRRVSSATVALDGSIVLGPSAFNQSRDSWTVSVTPGTTTVQLSATIAGAPGSFLEASLYGRRAATLFCPDGRPGSIPDLQLAIDATPAQGTLLVCDGEHEVKATINKPLTLRSENPDGAVLADAEVAPASSNHPILRVDGVAEGLVRVTDIAIRVSDRGIMPSGAFDQVVIEDVAFVGPGGGVFGLPQSVAVRVEGSSVPSARVTVSDSRFELLDLGVWPVNRVETIVTGSTFDRFGGGGVVFSNGSTVTTQSFGRAEDNHFTNCGTGGCIRVLTTGAVIVARNTLVAGNQSTSLGAITVNPTLRMSGSPAIVEDNIITSAATAGSPSTPAGWRFAHGIQLIDANSTRHVVRRNTISDAFSGITFGGSGDATNNRITGGFRAFEHQASHGVLFQRNDATGQSVAFAVASMWGGQYQCNYWGGGAPPGVAATVPAASYTPFVTTPIAGTSTPCDPSADFGVVRVCNDGASGTMSTLAEAVALVAPGGTVLVCDGTHAAPGVAISRQMSIESEGPMGATLDAGGASHALIIGAIAGSPFTVSAVRGLRFVGGSAGNVLVNDFARTLVFTENEFNPPTTAPYGGPPGTRSAIDVPGIGVPQMTISGNRFSGGDIGFHATNFSGTYVITGNEFAGQNNAAIRITTDNFAITGVSANSFRDCGPETCVFTRRPISFVNNSVTIDIARPTATPLFVDNLTTGSSSIQGNTIAGVGQGGVDRATPATYPITGSAMRIRGRAVVRLNEVANAYSGIAVTSAEVTGTDNSVEQTYVPFAGIAPSAGSIDLQRSDAVDYVLPLVNPSLFSSVNLRCNYWGSPAGPVSVPAGFESAFNPFSIVSIARQGVAVSCP